MKTEARKRKIELIVLPTAKAILILRRQLEGTSAILHVTC